MMHRKGEPASSTCREHLGDYARHKMPVLRSGLRALFWILPALIAAMSFVANTGVSAAAGGRVTGSVLIPALSAIYGSDILSTFSSLGIKGTTRAEIPETAFKVLGFALLFASFVPVLIAAR